MQHGACMVCRLSPVSARGAAGGAAVIWAEGGGLEEELEAAKPNQSKEGVALSQLYPHTNHPPRNAFVWNQTKKNNRKH